MVKLLDVAREAGVSRSTASNVFAHPQRVKEGLREKVLSAANKLGYGGPSPAGRLLRLGRVNAIGVTPPGAYGTSNAFSNPYLREFLYGVSTECDIQGASLTIVSGIGPDRTSGIKNSLVDGFILHQSEDAALIETRRRRLPFVLVDAQGDADTSYVRIDDRGGAYMAAKHLADLGHRRFAIISVLRRDLGDLSASRVEPIFHGLSDASHKLVRSFSMDEDRLSGYAEALAEVGISIDQVPIVECAADSVLNAARGARLLFDGAPEATAILAMTDVQALAVLEEARRRNVSIPEDLSVVGFDDIAEASMGASALTTVVHPIAEKGRVAARILFDDQAVQQVTLPVSLAVRSTTAPPRRSKTRGPQSLMKPLKKADRP